MLIHRSRSPLKGLLAASLLAVLSLAAATSAQATTLPTLTLAVTPTTITVGGSTQSGAVNVVTSGTGIKEASAILFLMKPGVTDAEAEAVLKKPVKDPNDTAKYGSIVFDVEVASHGSVEAQTYLQPGNYLRSGAGRRKGREGLQLLHGDGRGVAGRAADAGSDGPLDRLRLPRTEGRCTTASSFALKTKAFSCTWTLPSPRRASGTPRRPSGTCSTGKEKGIEKLSSESRSVRGPALPRSLPAGDDHGKAGLVRAGLLHGNTGRPRPHASLAWSASSRSSNSRSHGRPVPTRGGPSGGFSSVAQAAAATGAAVLPS